MWVERKMVVGDRLKLSKVKRARKIIKIARITARRNSLNIYSRYVNKIVKRTDSEKYFSAKTLSTVKWLLYLKMDEISKETRRLRKTITKHEEQATSSLLLPGILSSLSEVINTAVTHCRLNKRKTVTVGDILFAARLQEAFQE